MIYLDSSVALAQLLAEDKRPDPRFWDQPLIASRLLEYEVWVRLNKLQLTAAQREAAANFLGRLAFVEMIPEIISRAREKAPGDLRTLDALHLASASFLVHEGLKIRLATYDARMKVAANRLKIPLTEL